MTDGVYHQELLRLTPGINPDTIRRLFKCSTERLSRDACIDLSLVWSSPLPPLLVPVFSISEALLSVVMDGDRMVKTLLRTSHEIVERNRGLDGLALIGIRTRGVPIAARLAHYVQEITGSLIPMGALDITLYRDDLMRQTVAPQPVVRRTEIPFSIDDRQILLVDDVLYTGRTIRSALDALIDLGRPRAIQLVVLVDRGHRELPIRADYVGKNIPTSLDESVQVRLMEIDGMDEVTVERGDSS